ncbi:MAG: response regulator [Bdellovibrionales bacterium]|nr:response regulator [Bdellovibrionales bacterium]
MSFQALIIDDDDAFRKILERRLSSFIENLVVTSFSSISEARNYLNEIHSFVFDLVVVDEHLLDGSGTALISEGWFNDWAVLSMSSDDAPEIPGGAIQAGATYFINKRSVSEALFQPLVKGIIDRNRLQRELAATRINHTILDTVKTLVGTLRHEINNPLGAVLGAAYVLQRNEQASPEQKEAAELVESSGKRIKHVLDELCHAIEMQPVTKANHKVFHIPGDAPWEDQES